MIPVVWLGKGLHFGDSALRAHKDPTSKSNLRNATIRCECDCIFATMSKDDYQSILDRADQRRIEKLVDFFK